MTKESIEHQLIKLVHGVGEPQPVFKTEEEEQAHAEAWRELMEPIWKEHKKARAGSLRKAQDHRVD